MDKKHKSESDILVHLMDALQMDKTEYERVTNMNDEVRYGLLGYGLVVADRSWCAWWWYAISEDLLSVCKLVRWATQLELLHSHSIYTLFLFLLTVFPGLQPSPDSVSNTVTFSQNDVSKVFECLAINWEDRTWDFLFSLGHNFRLGRKILMCIHGLEHV